VTALPPESDRLLALRPSEFVAERQRLARELREAGREDDAAAVAALRKPSTVVFAVNRAARDRPNAARDAAEAAARVEKTQVGGDPDAFKSALGELSKALDLLSEVALAHLGADGREPTEAMRRRAHDLVRRAVGNSEARDRLGRGALLDEEEVAGFEAFAGAPVKAAARKPRASRAEAKRADARRERRERREAELRGELERAERELAEASRAAQAAESERARAERLVAAIRSKLERLG
jgi:hypothetical protein